MVLGTTNLQLSCLWGPFWPKGETLLWSKGCSDWFSCLASVKAVGCKSMHFLANRPLLCTKFTILITWLCFVLKKRYLSWGKWEFLHCTSQINRLFGGSSPTGILCPQMSWKPLLGAVGGDTSWGHSRALQEAPLSPRPKGPRYLDSCLPMNGTLWQKN